MKTRLYFDASGSPRAEYESPFELLGNFLEQDVQGSRSYCEEMLQMIDRVSTGKTKKFQYTGNAHTISLALEEVCIESEIMEGLEPCRLSLDVLKKAITDWKTLLDSRPLPL